MNGTRNTVQVFCMLHVLQNSHIFKIPLKMDIQLPTPLNPLSTCQSDNGKIREGTLKEVLCVFTYPYNLQQTHL